MSISTLKGENCNVELWSPLYEVESEALTQLRNVTKLPWVYHHVAAMADVHVGKGCTVGSVIAMKDAVSPAAVGVDIGCGMGAIKVRGLTASMLPSDLTALRHQIERDIPVGFNEHKAHAYAANRGLEKRTEELFGRFETLTPEVEKLEGRARKQVGTLGGGNHFIELCIDDGTCNNCLGYGAPVEELTEAGRTEVTTCVVCTGTGKVDPGVWLMLHSGSRNIGKELAEIHIDKAKTLIHNQKIIDRDMAVFLAGTPEMASYRNDLYWSQEYALLNRPVMFTLFKNAVRKSIPHPKGPSETFGFEEPILCHHNYTEEEVHFGEKVFLTRKGAISAKLGELGIIPGSMGTRSYIVRGKGNPESFNSASHGAGRKMSRGQAKRTFTLADLEEQTAGVCCRKDQGVLDEIPGAYKRIEDVMANQTDLVEVVATIKQVLCVKG